MQYSCYIEINILCMILLGIIYGRQRQNDSIVSSSQIIMRHLIAAAWALCISDIVAIVCRGRFFPGARILIEGSNLIYLEMMPVISMLWYRYTCIRIGKKPERRTAIWMSLPLVGFTVIALANPIIHFLFTINADNLYSRGPGVLLHWIASWFYFISAGILSFRAIRSAPSLAQRNEYKPLLNFLVLPGIGCATQMILYGVTSVQAGITLSLILVTMQMQDNQISADELTGINNRKAMRHYIDSSIHRNNSLRLTVMMIDVNKFKKINDTLGHSVGDMALRDTADILRSVCGKFRERLFLCRYGGDEFVIIGQNVEDGAADELAGSIRQRVHEFGKENRKPYMLDVSIGSASGICEDYEDFSHLLRLADETMYEDKKKGR